jgi:hypothetical protein
VLKVDVVQVLPGWAAGGGAGAGGMQVGPPTRGRGPDPPERDHVLDLQHPSVDDHPGGDPAYELPVEAGHDIDGVRPAGAVGVVVGVLDMACGGAAVDGERPEAGQRQLAGGLGRRGQRARLPRPGAAGQGGDGGIGGRQVPAPGPGAVGAPLVPPPPAVRDPERLGGGAAQLVGAAVADLGVVAVIQLPAAPVSRPARAAASGWIVASGRRVAAGLGQADRDRHRQPVAGEPGGVGGGGQPDRPGAWPWGGGEGAADRTDQQPRHQQQPGQDQPEQPRWAAHHTPSAGWAGWARSARPLVTRAYSAGSVVTRACSAGEA